MQQSEISNEELVYNIQIGRNVLQNMDMLWQQNQGLVCKTARKYSDSFHVEFDDLVQEAFLGLYEAAKRYDPDKGSSFFGYAERWIKCKMRRFCQNDSSIRIPAWMSENVRKYERYIDSFFQDKGREPSDAEISDYLGISGKKLDEVRKASRMRQIESLDRPAGDDSDNVIGDLLSNGSDMEGDVLDSVELAEIQKNLWPVVDELPELQRNVLKLRYLHGTTIQAAGEALGISYGKARTTEQDALRALRRPSRRRRLDPFLPDTVVSRAYHGSVKSFNHSWTSSTEGAVLKLIGEE